MARVRAKSIDIGEGVWDRACRYGDETHSMNVFSEEVLYKIQNTFIDAVYFQASSDVVCERLAVFKSSEDFLFMYSIKDYLLGPTVLE